MDKNNKKEGQCNFFVTRKKRFCRMTVRTGAYYCGEHEPKVSSPDEVSKDDQSILRMACPLDPKHSCYISKLEKHLKVCNAKKVNQPLYISHNCNLSDGLLNDSDNLKEEGKKRSLANVSEKVLLEVVKIVEKIFDDLISGNIVSCERLDCHPSVAVDLERDRRGDRTRRHLLQTSSLLYILTKEGLVAEDTCFVELGAGKGHLSYYLSKAVHGVSGCSVLLVDRASHRHKQDNKLRGVVESASQVERLRADIAHLVLAKVPAVSSSRTVVAMSKHLCGVATDLALRCMTTSEILAKASGLVMATCCHHRCVWESYVGRTFLQDNNITALQFDVICGLVSWATCGSGLSRERRDNLNHVDSSKVAKKAKLSEDSKQYDKDTSIGTAEKDSNLVTTHKDNKDSNLITINEGKKDSNLVTINEGKKDSNLITIDEGKKDSNLVTINEGKKDSNLITLDEGKKDSNFVTINEGKNDIEYYTEDIERNVMNNSKEIDDGNDSPSFDSETDSEESEIEDSDRKNATKTKYVSVSKNLGLSLRKREEIGFKAKAVLDWGRLLYLRNNKFNVKLCFYVDKSLSPENVCIVAVKNI